MNAELINEIKEDLYFAAVKYERGDIGGEEFASIIKDYLNTGVTCSGITIDVDTKMRFMKTMGQ